MSMIAIDIALLPPDDVMDICVDLCAKYPDQSGRPGLNKTDNLPHISLFMGMVEESKFRELSEQLAELVAASTPIHTSLARMTSVPSPDQEDATYFFEIENTPALYALHETLVDNLEAYYPNTDDSMFLLDKHEVFRPHTLWWTNKYITDSSKEQFWPHITLKACNEPVYTDMPLPLILDRLAITHMGNSCTVKKILFETRLTESQ